MRALTERCIRRIGNLKTTVSQWKLRNISVFGTFRKDGVRYDKG